MERAPDMKYRIAVTATDDFPVALPVVQEVLKDVGELFTVPMPYRPLTPAETRHFENVFRAVDAVLVRPGVFSRRILEAAARLRIIAVHGAGVDQLDVQAATELGIIVANAPGANANAVAELTLCLILSLLRRVSDAVREVRFQGQWGEARFMGRELRGQVVGLVGVGAVGRRVAALASAFGARVIAHDRYVDQASIGDEIELTDFDSLLRDASIVSLHIPLNAETHGMFDARRFQRMKRGAMIVNTSRGGLIDEAALAEMLTSGHLAGAALDVIADESAEARAEFFRSIGDANVLVTPHMGGSTAECLDSVAALAAEQIACCLRGEAVPHLVNKSVRPRPSLQPMI
jgi:D-3-phosphoglycerate dehydrogenase